MFYRFALMCPFLFDVFFGVPYLAPSTPGNVMKSQTLDQNIDTYGMNSSSFLLFQSYTDQQNMFRSTIYL